MRCFLALELSSERFPFRGDNDEIFLANAGTIGAARVADEMVPACEHTAAEHEGQGADSDQLRKRSVKSRVKGVGGTLQPS